MTASPVRIILDTDMGNDIDDALALALLHALAARGECELVGVASSKDNPWSIAYVGTINRFYGYGHIPLAAVQGGKTPDDGAFTRRAVLEAGPGNGAPAHGPERPAPDAVGELRRWLAGEADGSVVMVTIGFFTNLARLFASPADEVSGLDGLALFGRKVKRVCSMAGNFSPEALERPEPRFREYNVAEDLDAARTFAEKCPVPVVWSGFEVGLAVPFAANGFARACAAWSGDRHPVLEGYRLFHEHAEPAWRRGEPMTHFRPTWDLTAALHAVRPEDGYFDLSPAGRTGVREDGLTDFVPRGDGRDRYLRIPDARRIERLTEAFTLLCSQPPRGFAARDTAR